jgi:signal transduction histidine kinase
VPKNGGTTETIAAIADWERQPATGSGSRPGCLVGLAGTWRGTKRVIEDDLVVGRSTRSGLTLDRSEVSRRHAEIRYLDGAYLLRDLGSRNGTFVNGVPVTDRELVFGDRIAFAGHDLFLFTVHDRIHEQVLASQRLEVLGRLAAGVAHDFNNVLTIIDANTHILAALTDHPDAAGMMDDILLAAARGKELVSQLTSMARPCESQSSVDVSALTGEVERLLRRLADPSIAIEVAVEPGLRVDGHRSQLFQALLNLCTNAVDAVEPGATIRLRASRHDGWVRVEVADDGRGMTAEARARIFEPFFTTRAESGGSGIGMAVVHDVVTGHGGTIDVTSEPGRGTSVRISLPATAAVR